MLCLDLNPSLHFFAPPPMADGETLPDKYTEVCPVCSLDVNALDMTYSACCSQSTCATCLYEWSVNKHLITCPYCRAQPVSSGQKIRLLQSQSDKPRAHFELGMTFLRLERCNEALEQFLLADEKGDKKAAYMLGYCFEYSQGVAQSITKAIEYYQKGSDHGIQGCSFNLGLLYSNEGPHQDFGKAVHFMKVAVHQQSEHAYFELGKWYLEGQCGLAVDDVEGIKLLTMSADDGLQSSQYHLGLSYFNQGNVEQAMKYLKMTLIENKFLPFPDEHRSHAIAMIAECYIREPHTSYCSNCNKVSGDGVQVMMCGCRVVSYCNRVCQRANWDSHKEICRKVRE